MEHHQPDIYGEIFLAGNPGTPQQVIRSAGPGAQAFWQSEAPGAGIVLPEPRVSIESGAFTSVGAPGGTLTTTQYLHLKAHEIPDVLRTDPAIKAQIELVRYRKSKHLKRGTSPSRRQSAGWVHPVNVAGNVSGPHEGGMRAGLHSPVLTSSLGSVAMPDRKTEWPILGATPYGALAIVDIVEIFGKFFRVSRVADDLGGGIQAWTALDGSTFNRGIYTGGFGQRRAGRVTNIVRFAFRYSYLDPATNRRVTGPMTQPMIAYISPPLFHHRIPGQSWERIVNPAAEITQSFGSALRAGWGTDKQQI